MCNYGVKEEDLISNETKIKLEKYMGKKYLGTDITYFPVKIELIRKHREMFGSDLKTAKESIEIMFFKIKEERKCN